MVKAALRGFFQRLPGTSGKFSQTATPNPPTNTVDFIRLDSSVMLCLRVGIVMSIGNFRESLSQAMLVGVMLVRKSGVLRAWMQY